MSYFGIPFSHLIYNNISGFKTIDIVKTFSNKEGEKMYPRIRDLREDSDRTQREVSEYLFCDQSLYSKYERGMREVPVSVIIQLAKLYGTSTDYILGLTNVKKPYK